MKNKKTISIIAGAVAAVVACVGVLVFLAPWNDKNSNKSDSNNSAQSEDAAYNTKGKCKFYECLSKMSLENTPEDAEKIIGFKPEIEKDDARESEKYTWNFDDDHAIELNVSTHIVGSKAGEKYTSSIKISNYEYDDVAQKGVIFDNVNEIKSKINKGGVSYEEFKEKMGGVDGILMEIGNNKKYEWRSIDAEGYIAGTFSSDGECTFMNGLTY